MRQTTTEDLVMTDRVQGVDCYWCEDGTPHRHEHPEPALLVARRRLVAALHAMHADQQIIISLPLAETLAAAWEAYDAAILATANARAEQLAGPDAREAQPA